MISAKEAQKIVKDERDRLKQDAYRKIEEDCKDLLDKISDEIVRTAGECKSGITIKAPEYLSRTMKYYFMEYLEEKYGYRCEYEYEEIRIKW